MFKNTLKQKEPTYLEQIVQTFKEFRDIGETFEYMGLIMRVTAHTEWIWDIGHRPAFRCDYVDKNNVIHNVSFSIDEIRALQSQELANKKDKIRQMLDRGVMSRSELDE